MGIFKGDTSSSDYSSYGFSIIIRVSGRGCITPVMENQLEIDMESGIILVSTGFGFIWGLI